MSGWKRKRVTQWEACWGDPDCEDVGGFATRQEALDYLNYLQDNHKRLVKIRYTWLDDGHGNAKDTTEERDEVLLTEE